MSFPLMGGRASTERGASAMASFELTHEGHDDDELPTFASDRPGRQRTMALHRVGHGNFAERVRRRLGAICPLPFVVIAVAFLAASVFAAVVAKPAFQVAGSATTCFTNRTAPDGDLQAVCSLKTQVVDDLGKECFVNPTVSVKPSCRLAVQDVKVPVPAWQAYFVFNACLLAIVASVMDGPVVLLMLMASTSFVFCGIVTEAEIFEGFGSASLIALAQLFILSKAVEWSGLFDILIVRTLGNSESINIALMRLMPATALVCAFINNTPLVAMMNPVLLAWSKQKNLDPMKICLPIAYIAGLGGMLSKIGSSTNLVTADFQFDPRLKFELGFFDLAPVAVILIVVCMCYNLVCGPWLCRASVQPRTFDVGELPETSLYKVLFIVMEDSQLVGKSWHSRGLTRLPKTKLLNGPGDLGAPPNESAMICPGHQVLVCTDAEGVAVLRRIRGLVIAGEAGLALKQTGVYRLRQRRLFEAVLIEQTHSNLGQWMLQEHGTALIACRGEGLAREARKSGNQILLVDALETFEKTAQLDFALIRQVKDSAPLRIGRRADPYRAWVSVSVMGTVILFQSIGLKRANGQPVVPLASACLWGVSILVGFDIMTPTEALSSINGNAWLALCSAFGLGKGIQNSGLADFIAHGLTQVAAGSPMGIAGGFFIVASVLSNLMSNTATTLMMLPIAERVALSEGIPLKTLVFTILYGANCVFATPIGTSTNMVAQSPGGSEMASYSFMDFVRYGTPLQIIMLLICVPVTVLIYGTTGGVQIVS